MVISQTTFSILESDTLDERVSGMRLISGYKFWNSVLETRALPTLYTLIGYRCMANVKLFLVEGRYLFLILF